VRYPRRMLCPDTTLFRSQADVEDPVGLASQVELGVDEGGDQAEQQYRRQPRKARDAVLFVHEPSGVDLVQPLGRGQDLRPQQFGDRKSTRLNSSHVKNSY